MNLLNAMLRYLLATSLLLPWAVGAQGLAGIGGTGNVVTTEQVRAELMAWAPDGIGAGKTLWLGLQLTHQPQWHTYWKNSGDSGQPTRLSWTLPAGVQAGDIAWPTPKILPTGDLVTYGLDGTTLLPVPLTVGADFKPDLLNPELEVKLQANWLVCKLQCIPQEGRFSLRLPLNTATTLNAGVFAAAFADAPKALAGSSQIKIEGNHLELLVTGLPTALQGQKLDFFPEVANLVEAGAPWRQNWTGAQWHASVPISNYRDGNPASLPLVLAADVDGQRLGVATSAAIVGVWPAVTPLDAASSAAQVAPTVALAGVNTNAPAAGVEALGLWLALLGALLGGLLLNLMPCVFPVLAIKVLGLTQHADDWRTRRNSGVAYSLGVVLSFVALGALMLVLRHAGQQLGWGFQLQSPAVLAALAALFTLIGLNLLGVFELAQVLPSRLATLQARHPTGNAALSGVLAVAVASPCTAPFMAAAIGLTLVVPPAQALLIFATLGLGMALPYLLVSCAPNLARRLPRPGAWMQTLRQLLAFPMFATVIWLLWVLGQQTGINAVASLLALLLTLALLLWALALKTRARLALSVFALALLLVLAWGLGAQVLRWPDQVGASSTSSRAQHWQDWTPAKVQAALARGQAVLVDFTAAWCVTCQYNEKTTLSDAQLLAELEAKKVLLLRADWTKPDPVIAATLAKLGRSGVPVYAFYQSGKAVQLLPELLSVADVRAVLAGL